VSAQGRLQRGGARVDALRGVEPSGLEGHGLLLGACMTAGSRTAPRSEALLLRRQGKQVVHPDTSGARLNVCEWNNLPATFSICSSMLR